MSRQQFVVVVPVKAPAIGKSRLRVPDAARPGLAAAFALDVLDAVAQVPAVCEVVVMTADAGFAARCAGLGFSTVPDGDDLNDGLRRAARSLRRSRPDAVPAALCADLPALERGDLAAALSTVTADRAWFCADAEGTGTTLYLAPYPGFEPQFGVGSRTAHVRAGAHPIPGELATLRRDVDDTAALEEAVGLGVGRHTRAALAPLVR